MAKAVINSNFFIDFSFCCFWSITLRRGGLAIFPFEGLRMRDNVAFKDDSGGRCPADGRAETEIKRAK